MNIVPAMAQEKLEIFAEKPPITMAMSPRLEIFHALRLVLSPPSGVDERWRMTARAKLPKSFYARVERYCANPVIWPNIGDAVESAALDGSFFQVLKAYAEISPERFRYVILEGMLHSAELARDAAEGKISLKDLVASYPDTQHAWLAFLGLFPFHEDAPIARFYERLVANPEVIRDETVRLLSEFWDYVFEDTWESIVPSMERSLATLERMIPTCSLREIADRTLLNVEVDEEAQIIRAGRVNFSMTFDSIERIHFIPSALNVNRLWTAFDNDKIDRLTVVFPYFDPSIQITDPDGRTRPASTESIEPPLVFRALGDTTRFAIAKIIAREPTSSTDLARQLGLAKGTVSHHVRILRVAGLIKEEWTGGSVTLSINRPTLENLSDKTVELLFSDE